MKLLVLCLGASVALALPAALTAAASARSTCDLSLRLGAASGPAGQRHVALEITNDDPAGTSCRVSGFPDVELIGPIDPTFGSIYFVPDQLARSEHVTIRVGHHADAALTWLPACPCPPNHRWIPGYVRVVVQTSAGPSLPMAVPWRFGSVLRQDGATHPGTFVGPVRAGQA